MCFLGLHIARGRRGFPWVTESIRTNLLIIVRRVSMIKMKKTLVTLLVSMALLGAAAAPAIAASHGPQTYYLNSTMTTLFTGSKTNSNTYIPITVSSGSGTFMIESFTGYPSFESYSNSSRTASQYDSTIHLPVAKFYQAGYGFTLKGQGNGYCTLKIEY